MQTPRHHLLRDNLRWRGVCSWKASVTTSLGRHCRGGGHASVGIRHRGAPIRARLLAGLESGGQRLQRGGQQLDCLRQFERTTYIRNKPTTTTTTTTTSYTTTTTTTQRLVPGLLDGPCPPSRRARPIAEQNTNKTKHPPHFKN